MDNMAFVSIGDPRKGRPAVSQMLQTAAAGGCSTTGSDSGCSTVGAAGNNGLALSQRVDEIGKYDITTSRSPSTWSTPRSARRSTRGSSGTTGA